MSGNPKLVQHGTAGGVAINVDVSRIESSVPVKVLLTANYAMLNMPGLPTRPCFTGAAAANLDYPKTALSGTTLTLLMGEAAALVSAGKASFA